MFTDELVLLLFRNLLSHHLSSVLRWHQRHVYSQRSLKLFYSLVLSALSCAWGVVVVCVFGEGGCHILAHQKEKGSAPRRAVIFRQFVPS